ncbi:MAG TPA: A24 family peptidase [Gemmataceae bacterium]|jgi:prepilin peptidase CpaA|nr:A24 family peptidase [Gemmataceae bacterium]
MALLHWENWPLLFICGGMIAAAVIDWWKFKVPNRLTFPLILSGWALGLLHTFGLEQGGHGTVWASLAGTALGFLLLLPIYAIGGMGAGDVKMTMGFGSWIGAFFGLEHGLCLWVVFYSFCAGVIVGGIIALAMMAVRGQFRKNIHNSREIVRDLFTSSSLGEVADKANRRRSRWHRLPYGVPLSIGFVGYLLLAGGPAPQDNPEPQEDQAVQSAPFAQPARVTAVSQATAVSKRGQAP